MQATAGLRALKGDASDRILQAVMFFSCSLEAIFMFVLSLANSCKVVCSLRLGIS